MKKRFREEQIIMILKERESGIPVRELVRKHGICENTYYRWKSKYGGMEVSEAKRLKALEDENRRLKQMVADLMLDNKVLKTSTQKTGKARREAQSSRLRDRTSSTQQSTRLRACAVTAEQLLLCCPDQRR